MNLFVITNFSVSLCAFSVQLCEIKRNYTELHREVTELHGELFALKMNANKLPLSSSTAFHTTTMVSAPKSAGKNLTPNTEPPKMFIKQEIQEVNGGTDR